MTPHAVVIVGGGPTGLMLAGELALASVDVVIVERRTSQELPGSRAGGLHARTLELLDQRGTAERFVALGDAAQVTSFLSVPLDIRDFPTRFNHGLAGSRCGRRRSMRRCGEENEGPDGARRPKQKMAAAAHSGGRLSASMGPRPWGRGKSRRVPRRDHKRSSPPAHAGRPGGGATRGTCSSLRFSDIVVGHPSGSNSRRCTQARGRVTREASCTSDSSTVWARAEGGTGRGGSKLEASDPSAPEPRLEGERAIRWLVDQASDARGAALGARPEDAARGACRGVRVALHGGERWQPGSLIYSRSPRRRDLVDPFS